MTLASHAGISHPARNGCPCPACMAEDALVLLATSRTERTRMLLERLPAVIWATIRAEREAAAGAALAARRGAANALDNTRCLIAAAEARLAEKAEPRRLECRREELASLAEVVMPKPSQVLAAALVDGRITAERAAAQLKLRPETYRRSLRAGSSCSGEGM